MAKQKVRKWARAHPVDPNEPQPRLPGKTTGLLSGQGLGRTCATFLATNLFQKLPSDDTKMNPVNVTRFSDPPRVSPIFEATGRRSAWH